MTSHGRLFCKAKWNSLPHLVSPSLTRIVGPQRHDATEVVGHGLTRMVSPWHFHPSDRLAFPFLQYLRTTLASVFSLLRLRFFN